MTLSNFIEYRKAYQAQISTAIAEYQNGLITLDELTNTLESLRIHLKKVAKDQREYERIVAEYEV